MDDAQMKKRCPSARFVGVAMLARHKLGFTRRSTTRGCGVADAVPERDHNLWGVVFEISDLDVPSLDQSEGYQPGRKRNAYWRRECNVLLEGNPGRPLSVSAYFAEREPDAPPPNQAYKDQILAGARYWRLPDDYITTELEAIQVSR